MTRLAGLLRVVPAWSVRVQLPPRMATKVISVRKDGAGPAARAGARALNKGGLVAFATETVYGVGAVATDSGAMERLRELKSRPKRPFSAHLSSPEEASRYIREMPWEARRLIAKGWPGPITILAPLGGRLADSKLQRAGLYDVLSWSDYVGLRCPDEPVAREMLRQVDAPLVAPSANRAGGKSPRSAEDVLDQLDGQIDLLLDCGRTKYGRNSTIVRCGPDGMEIVRKGAVGERTVRRLVRMRILYVCTGNTCRSPMAAGFAKKLLSEEIGCGAGDLRGRRVEVLSAGLLAGGGAPASPEAVRAARTLGADISHHRSRKLTRDLIRSADLILCMTGFHVAEVLRMAPEAAGKVKRLSSSGDIPDPIGGGMDVYAMTAQRVAVAVRDALSEGLS